MFGLFASLGRDRRGVSAVEFALFLPFLLLIIVGIIEFGRGYYHFALAQRGVRAAALFAARNELPLTVAAKTTMENLAKTGTADGTGEYLSEGWAHESSKVFIVEDTFTSGAETVDVIRVTARVRYDPLLPGLFNSVGFDFNNFFMKVDHDQAYIGD